MKSKPYLSSEPESDNRRSGGKQEISPVRSSAPIRTRGTTRTNTTGKRNSTPAASSPSPGPSRTAGSGITATPSPGPTRTTGLGNTSSPYPIPTRTTGPGSASSPSPAPTRTTGNASSPSPAPTRTTGPGRTPQTKRRELSLSQTEKNSPSGSPRTRDHVVKPQTTASRKTTQARSKADAAGQSNGSNPEESFRKSSNSSQDSGIVRDVKPSRSQRHVHGGSKARYNTPTIRTTSPETVEVEVSSRKKFEELCDVKNVELGIVKVPPEVLDDLIHKGSIENYYDVDCVPVASGVFATVRKCTNKETGVEYAAKFSSRVRCGVDCTVEVLHEIALLSICAESSKIVHLKDVFQSKHEIVLVLEYAPGGDFQSVLDDDMVPFEQDVQGFIVQLLEALSYIHQRNIAHLDIKPQNIVLMSEFPNCEIKLCDLEVSRVIQDTEQIREIIGTPDYVAPEILGMDPITLAADIWSLGVLAYVLLTGFSPFGGDSDQETLRNITTAPLDFPAELFEGVSEDAKEFITKCLARNPKNRPTVDECLQHPWISQNTEPPSPSPLMLKIPAPDHYVSSPSFGDPPSSSASRRSCQTCRDKITERKRYLSKSREAIFEKVANSNLKKSLSKSRERLCDMRLTLSKSRDYLNESKMVSRPQEKFYGFKSLSRSQEVLSQALGGTMKRMVNGAVSDISPAHLPINPRVYLDTPDSCDFVILPGSSVLMSHSDIMSLSTRTSESLSTVPESESSNPSSSFTPALTSINVSESQTDPNINATTVKPGVHTVIEVSEEEEELDENDNSREGTQKTQVILRRDRDTRSCETFIPPESKTSRRKSSHELRNMMTAKEEKNNMNYETKQSMSRSASTDGLHKNNNNVKNKTSEKNETAEVAVQVNLSKCNSSPNIIRRERRAEGHPSESTSLSSSSSKDSEVFHETIPRSFESNITPEKRLSRGFSHEDTLGEESKRYSWREELERFRSMRKPLAVSELIDTFSNKSSLRKVSSDDPSFSDIDSLKNKRRGSLQIQINPKELARLTEKAENDKSRIAAKLQRRRSTSALMPLRTAEVKMPGIAEDIGLTLDKYEETQSKDQTLNSEKKDDEKESSELDSKEKTTKDEDLNKIESNKGSDNNRSPNKGRVYLEKVNERKRTWDYFEINHPKAISDKKLEQLKAKYTRRKTETSLQAQGELKKKDPNCNSTVKKVPPHSRAMSMPLIKGAGDIKRKNLELAWDPLTGESIGGETESVDSGKGGETTREPSICSTEDIQPKVFVENIKDGHTKSCIEGETDVAEKDTLKNRRNSFLNSLSESDYIIPGEKVLECFIDPFTGHFITNQVPKESGSSDINSIQQSPETTKNLSNLQVNTKNENIQQGDDGIGSLPNTPTDLGKNKSLSVTNTPVKDAQIEHELSSHEVVLRDTSNAKLSDSALNRLSAISLDDPLDPHGKADSNGSSKRGNAGQGTDSTRQRRNSGGRERAQANKICTGSFSRGFERFRSESPVTIKNKSDV